MQLGIGFRQETAEVSSPLLVYIDLLVLLHSISVEYVLYGNVFYSISNNESNKSKCCLALPGEWVPANAGTHAEPLCTYTTLLLGVH